MVMKELGSARAQLSQYGNETPLSWNFRHALKYDDRFEDRVVLLTTISR